MKTRNPIIGTLANDEDPVEMQHDAAFHQGLHSLLRQNRSSEKETEFFFEGAQWLSGRVLDSRPRGPG